MKEHSIIFAATMRRMETAIYATRDAFRGECNEPACIPTAYMPDARRKKPKIYKERPEYAESPIYATRYAFRGVRSTPACIPTAYMQAKAYWRGDFGLSMRGFWGWFWAGFGLVLGCFWAGFWVVVLRAGC